MAAVKRKQVRRAVSTVAPLAVAPRISIPDDNRRVLVRLTYERGMSETFPASNLVSAMMLALDLANDFPGSAIALEFEDRLRRTR